MPLFDVSIFQRRKYTVHISGDGVDVPAAVGGEVELAYCRRCPGFSGFEDPWAPPAPAGESRSGAPDTKESPGGASRWPVVESRPVSAFGEHALDVPERHREHDRKGQPYPQLPSEG